MDKKAVVHKTTKHYDSIVAKLKKIQQAAEKLSLASDLNWGHVGLLGTVDCDLSDILEFLDSALKPQQ